MKLKNWKLKIDNGDTVKVPEDGIPAGVPGDVTVDLFRAGLIEDPYVGLNHKNLGWIAESDFTYFTQFDADDEIFSREEILLTFYGIDLFSEIYLNGTLLGKTENAFLKYEFSVKNLLKSKGNRLVVKMKSTIQAMKSIDCSGYFGVFNVPRLFLRKAQCHFGWDWAPNLCGYGICDEVTIEGVSKYRVENVCVRTTTSGYATMIAELNYNVRSAMDSYGVEIKNSSVPKDGDKLRYYLETAPGSDEYVTVETEVTGKKNFANLKVENPELWYPIGYGNHPLYRYKTELLRGDKVVSEKSGRIAFREVKLLEEPKNSSVLGYDFLINGKKVYIKGSDWVPAECFFGCMTDEKYEKLVRLAVRGNFNMLRVWGGGNFERDKFYDLCDENGVMVWQDFMYACADIPEDDEKWVANTLKECEYQIKRLRNHPSLVYWCGGNEKTGTYGLQISKGDYFVDCILSGLVRTLDPTRPFARQSPCSITDVGNDLTSGESHYNSFEATLSTYPATGKTAITQYRKLVAKKVVAFASECAVLGPNSEETDKKIYPPDKLWPLNEVWEDRMMDNPYAGIVIPFLKREELYIRDTYGEARTLSDFTAKGMQIQAEALKTEIEFARANKDVSGGIMNWMYSDIWPSGTWAIIDYYLEPKQAYYQLKRSYQPLYATFVYCADGKTRLAVMNDTFEDVEIEIRYGKKTVNGEVVAEKTFTLQLPAGGLYREETDLDPEGKDSYLFVEYGGKKTLYTPDFWRNCAFSSRYDVKTKLIDPHKLQATIKADTFVKALFFSFKDNYAYLYDDNYIDMEAGEERTVEITSEREIDPSALQYASFDERTK